LTLVLILTMLWEGRGYITLSAFAVDMILNGQKNIAK